MSQFGCPWDGAENTPCLVNAGRGIVPWQALGLSMGDVQDGWSNFFTYRVANRTPATSSNWTLRQVPRLSRWVNSARL